MSTKSFYLDSIPVSPLTFPRCGECGHRTDTNIKHSTACSHYDHRTENASIFTDLEKTRAQGQLPGQPGEHFFEVVGTYFDTVIGDTVEHKGVFRAISSDEALAYNSNNGRRYTLLYGRVLRAEPVSAEFAANLKRHVDETNAYIAKSGTHLD